MKLPRDLSSEELIKALKPLGYTVTRQKGSHIRITTDMHGQHHEAIPAHSPLKAGTLRGILRNVAIHHKMAIEDLIRLIR